MSSSVDQKHIPSKFKSFSISVSSCHLSEKHWFDSLHDMIILEIWSMLIIMKTVPRSYNSDQDSNPGVSPLSTTHFLL